MFQQNLTLHETMEIHELINLKTACRIKSKMVQGLVFDRDLKALLDKDVQQSVSAANVLQGLLTDIDNSDGMPELADSTIALEFLLSIKTGIRNSAIAITEIENPKARAATRDMLNDAISLHGEVTDLMISKGWLLPYEGYDALSMGKGIAPHETFDLHELLTMKNVCATKSYAMSKLVKDEELKSILQQDLAAAKEHLRELEGLIQSSVLASSGAFKTLKAAQTFQPVQTSKYAASDSLDTVKDKEVPPKTGQNQQKGASI